MAKTYTVIYRTGGTATYQWHEISERYATRETAQVKASELETAGYPSLVHDSAQLAIIGLPEGE